MFGIGSLWWRDSESVVHAVNKERCPCEQMALPTVLCDCSYSSYVQANSVFGSNFAACMCKSAPVFVHTACIKV